MTRRCHGCNRRFTPEPYQHSFVQWCSIDCGVKVARERQDKKREKVRARVQAVERKELRKRKEALKSKTDWANEAQQAVNAYIRERDYSKPCISCDRPHDGSHQRHASHYRSVKAAKQLRFNLQNIWASCQQCNTAESGNSIEYRIRLVRKLGTERVEALEANHDLADYSIEYLQRVKRIFSKRARQYKRRREARYD